MRTAKFFLTVLILSGSFTGARAAFEFKGIGSTFMASGYSAMASPVANFAIFNNPANLAFADKAGVDFFYRNFYGLREINQFAVGAHYRFSGISAGAGAMRFGNHLYQESLLATAVAYPVIAGWSVALRLNWQHLTIKNYGQSSAISFDVGSLYSVTERMHAGIIFANITEAKIGQATEKLPMHLMFGLAYNPLPELELTAAAFKDDRFDFSYRFGLSYQILRGFRLMSGFIHNENILCGGLRISFKNFALNYALEYHPELNASHSFGIGYAF